MRITLGPGGFRRRDAAAYRRERDGSCCFDVVILDLTIRGGIGGREVLSELQKTDPEVVAVVSSGYSDDPVLAKPGDYGFRAVLQKPFFF